MYTQKAVERLNNINWTNIGQNGQKKDIELGIEFIKRMAEFCIENDIIPGLPFMTDLTFPLENDVINDEILKICNNDVRNVIKNPSLSTSIVNYYLKASVLSDRDIKYAACINVYKPIIRLFEKGGYFVYRERGMSFINSGIIPLADWFNNFKKLRSSAADNPGEYPGAIHEPPRILKSTCKTN